MTTNDLDLFKFLDSPEIQAELAAEAAQRAARAKALADVTGLAERFDCAFCFVDSDGLIVIAGRPARLARFAKAAEAADLEIVESDDRFARVRA